MSWIFQHVIRQWPLLFVRWATITHCPRELTPGLSLAATLANAPVDDDDGPEP